MRAAVVLALAAPGCSPSPAIDPVAHGYTTAGAEAFQVAADKNLAGPVSPLTAVSASYIAAGESLATHRTAPQQLPAGESQYRVEIEVEDSGAIVVRHIVGGEKTHETIGPVEVQLGARVLVISEQSQGARMVEHDPAAPDRSSFERRPWFPIDAAAIVIARRRDNAKARSVTLRTSRGLDKTLPVAGVLEGQLHGTSFSLTAFGSPTGDWLVPFTDPSNGESSYPAGRYLTVPPDAREGDHVVLDFNRAVNPWCAYSELYNCPIPPAENSVTVSLEAGERVGSAH